MKARKILFWIHLVTGCLVGCVVLTMSITGVLLAYERQILSWVDRDRRPAPPAPGVPRLPIEAMLSQVISERSGTLTAVTVHSDAAAAAEVSFGREHVVLVDPYSGRILGESSAAARAFFQRVENWHRWLGANDEHRAGGRAVTGACNLGFLLLVISGPFLWLPRRWSPQSFRAVAWFRGGLSGRARDFNWHNVIGIWCAAPLFVIVFSGVVMSYSWANDLLYRLTGSEPPSQGTGPRSNGDSRQAPRGARKIPDTSGQSREAARQLPAHLDIPWTRAETLVPNWRSIVLRLPPSGRGPVTFMIDTGNSGSPNLRSQLTLDGRTGDVIRWEPFSSYSKGRRIRSWLRFLHTGEAGGLAGETVAAIATAGAAMLVFTGICLALRRMWRYKERLRSDAEPAAQDRTLAASR